MPGVGQVRPGACRHVRQTVSRCHWRLLPPAPGTEIFFKPAGKRHVPDRGPRAGIACVGLRGDGALQAIGNVRMLRGVGNRQETPDRHFGDGSRALAAHGVDPALPRGFIHLRQAQISAREEIFSG